MSVREIPVIAAKDEVVHARKHARIQRTLCGLVTTNANTTWPKNHVYMDRDQIKTVRIIGKLCEKCLPYTASLRNPAS